MRMFVCITFNQIRAIELLLSIGACQSTHIHMVWSTDKSNRIGKCVTKTAHIDTPVVSIRGPWKILSPEENIFK